MNSAVTRIKSSRRASAITVAVLIVLVAVAAWFALVSPKRSHASTLKNEITAAQSQLVTAKQTAAVANKVAAAAALRAMPDDADEPGILDGLQALGKQTGVTIATVAPGVATAPATAVPLSLTVNGTYFQISTFLNKLRTQVRVGKGGRVVATGRLFDVQSVSLSPGAANGKLTATIAATASVYEAAAPAPAAAPAGSTS